MAMAWVAPPSYKIMDVSIALFHSLWTHRIDHSQQWNGAGHGDGDGRSDSDIEWGM